MEVAPFELAWKRFGGEQPMRGISQRLVPLLGQLYDQITCQPTNRAALIGALRQLLEYLASPEGRTDENCRATDFFLCLSDDVDWRHVPGDLADILAQMAGALHDTVSSPDVAENFDSTPEQLLQQLAGVPT